MSAESHTKRPDQPEQHGIPGLDPVLHFAKRTVIMGVLSSAATVEFAYLKEHLDLADSDLSKQMRTLADAGYVKSTRPATAAPATPNTRPRAPA